MFLNRLRRKKTLEAEVKKNKVKVMNETRQGLAGYTAWLVFVLDDLMARVLVISNVLNKFMVCI